MPTQELALSDPTTVGPFRLRGRLGSGGMGVVYVADAPDGRTVAVKCLQPGVGDEVRRRLQREADFLATIRHPRVARLVDADVHATVPWIAMQYIAGPSLAQAAVPLGPAQLRHLTEGIADALAAMHRQGLTHRDVKPGNIILTHDGPVLVDLGIASGAGLDSLTAVGMVVGTPEWMAPEQLSGRASGAATDIWGWGCIAVFAATGRTPFGTGEIDALAHRIRQGDARLDGVPDWLYGAVVAALDKDPARRPSAAELAAVDGIRRVGAAARSRAAADPGPAPHPARHPTPHPTLAPAVAPRHPAPRRTSLLGGPPRSAAGPVQRVRPVVPPARATIPAPVPARRAARPQPQPQPVQRTKSPRPAPAQRRRRSLGRRILRSLLWLLLLILLAAVIGVGVYTWVSNIVDDDSPGKALRDAWDWARGLVG